MPDDEEIPNLIDNDAVGVGTTTEAQPRTVPLTIICGFLGAGKSTLVKIAVIMNEFGDTADIEAKTINVSSLDDPSRQSEEFLELANGCLCCSIKDAGVAAIEKLMQRKGAFDHILLETTGLADPGPIASMFWQNEEYTLGLGRDLHLDGVVCVVDALFGRQQMEEDHTDEGIGENLRQIAGADVILLNKVDLVPPAGVDATEDVIRKINPAASIHRTVKGEIDLKHIMGIDAYSSRPLIQEPRSTSHGLHVDDHDHNDPAHVHRPTHYELRGISSLQVDCPALNSSQYSKLDEWIRSMLWEHRLPERISDAEGVSELVVLRCKGMFKTTAGDMHVLQGVRDLYDIMKVEEGTEAAAGVPDVGKIVLIGKGLGEEVRNSLEGVLRS